jgi:hypothetical protein
MPGAAISQQTHTVDYQIGMFEIPGLFQIGLPVWNDPFFIVAGAACYQFIW